MQPKRQTPPPSLLDVRDDDGHLLFQLCPDTLEIWIKQNKRPLQVVCLYSLIDIPQMASATIAQLQPKEG